MKRLIALTALAVIVSGPAFADGDPVRGEKIFRKCAACHMVGEDAKAKVGPSLNGVMGKPAGTNEEFASKYSGDMIQAGKDGLVWDEEMLDKYLEKPKDIVKKTKMAFAGLKKEDEREDVIAYLLQFSPDYEPAE